MFVHLLAGSLVFLLFGKIFNFETSRIYLLFGAFWGIVPDLISYILSWNFELNKWSHTHRDNFSHSAFFPGIVIVIAILLGSKMVIAVGVAMLTHPLLDLVGIGWGVKLFYPFSKRTYKVLYKGKILTVWNQDQVTAEAKKFGDDDWARNTYFKFNAIGVLEWLSLAGFLLLVAVN